MKIATVLFTYNRSMHTEKVLKALENNEILPEKLFIFQDGFKKSTNIKEWKRVSAVINAVSFCDTEVIIAEKNNGLSKSIISGLNYVFKNYDAVIVLEDDCVPHPKFMSYMINCLKKYECERKVFSIGGCAWPIDFEQRGADAYFCQRISSWGWGTWKDRWDEYEQDYDLLKKVENNSDASERLRVWGADLKEQLIGNITGKCDSWAVFWALKVIEKDGYCLSPYESLIANIGFDGTGVHSGTVKVKIKNRDYNNMSDHQLPNNIESSEECRNAFQKFLTYTSIEDKYKAYQNFLVSLLDKVILSEQFLEKAVDKKFAVWGLGKIGEILVDKLIDKIDIACIILSKPYREQYRGIPIVSIDDLPETVNTIIVIPFYDIKKIKSQSENRKKNIIYIGIDQLIFELIDNC